MTRHRTNTLGPRAAFAGIAAALALAALVYCRGDSTGPAPPAPSPSMGVQLSLRALNVVQGQTGAVNVLIARRGDFDAPVTLSVTGLPEGVTAVFNPPVIQPGDERSTLVLETAATAPAGTYTLRVIGTGATATAQSATLSFGVTPGLPPTVGLRVASPLPMTPGQQASLEVNLTRNGYAEGVLLQVTGVPAGVHVAFEPEYVPPGESRATLTLTTEVSAPPGTYALTVTGAAEDVRVQSVRLEVAIFAGTPAPITLLFISADDFAWTVQGDSWSWPGVSIMRGAGFSGDVTLSIDGLPAQVTAVFQPATLSGGVMSSTVTFTAGIDATPGESQVTIRASGAGVPDATHTFRFVVFPP